MLDITKLNTKLTELHDQDTTFINQIHDLYMRVNESTRKIELLDAMITDQRDVMDVQARKIRELTDKEFTGSDTISSIEEPMNNVELIMCPRCNTIINPNDAKPLDDDIVVGCGLKKGDFDECSNCGGEVIRVNVAVFEGN